MKHKSINEVLLSKLRDNLSIEYIASTILFDTLENTQKHLEKLVESGIIESDENKQYYRIKRK
jgi:hypothetical protein